MSSRYSTLRHTAILGLLAILALPSLTRAGVIRDDVDLSFYQDLANQPEYASVGFVSMAGFGSCSGTLIDSTWVLTAAHCVDSGSITSISFTVEGQTVEATDWFTHYGWTGDLAAGNDIALIQLAEPITGVNVAELYTGTNIFFQTATYVGYGVTGTGDTGYTDPGGDKLAGQNVIDITVFGSNPAILASDFDNPNDPNDSLFPTDPIPLPLEYLIAPGDSGGGVFIEDGGNTYLVGVNSFLLGLDGVADADYGDISGATNVTGFLDWIDRSIPVPTPLLLMLPWMALLAVRRLAASV